MSKLLVIGGPFNNQEVEHQGQVWTPMVMASDPNNPSMPSVAMPTTYVLRHLDGRFAEGLKRRGVYVHETVQNPMEMAQLLANILIGKWLEEGGEFVEEDAESGAPPEVVPNRNSNGAGPMGGEPPRTAGGLYLP